MTRVTNAHRLRIRGQDHCVAGTGATENIATVSTVMLGVSSNDNRDQRSNTNLAPFDCKIANTLVTCFDCFLVNPFVPCQTLVQILHIVMINLRILKLGGHVGQG